MRENLKSTYYSNGDIIGTTTPATFNTSGENAPKYQWAYNGDESNVPTYGRLYTWYVAIDERNIYPSGWHVPSGAEWTVLTDYLTYNGFGYGGSGEDIAKSIASKSGWTNFAETGAIGNNQLNNNSSGFTALPSGGRNIDGTFENLGNICYLLTTTEVGLFPCCAYCRNLFHNHDQVNKFGSDKGYGFVPAE